MKQLYATLEDKEKELRDFIRNYEQVRKRKKTQQKMDNNRIIIVSNKKEHQWNKRRDRMHIQSCIQTDTSPDTFSQTK